MNRLSLGAAVLLAGCGSSTPLFSDDFSSGLDAWTFSGSNPVFTTDSSIGNPSPSARVQWTLDTSTSDPGCSNALPTYFMTATDDPFQTEAGVSVSFDVAIAQDDTNGGTANGGAVVRLDSGDPRFNPAIRIDANGTVAFYGDSTGSSGGECVDVLQQPYTPDAEFHHYEMQFKDEGHHIDFFRDGKYQGTVGRTDFTCYAPDFYRVQLGMTAFRETNSSATNSFSVRYDNVVVE